MLNADQHQRLRQIGWQQESFFALARSEVATDLALTGEQRDQTKAILKDYATAHRGLLAKGLPPPELSQATAILQRHALDKLSLILTQDQKERWDQLLGEPFVLKARP